MRKFLRVFLAVLFAAVFVGTLVFLWRKTRPVVTRYETVTAHVDSIYRWVSANGKVEPRDDVQIKPQISGIISEVRCQAGDVVRTGDVIATVKVIPEMSTLNSVESRVSIARINFEQAERVFARTESLYESGLISREEYEQGQVSLSTAREELDNAVDALEITKSGLAEKYASMSNTQIRSTIDGMILDVPVKVGNSVIQANTFNDGTTIATVADMGDMIFRGNVNESDVGRIKVGDRVRVGIGALEDVTFEAVLEYISPQAVEQNGVVMFEIKSAMSAMDGQVLRAGYSANADILISSAEGVPVIPESVVEFDGEDAFVYVLVSDDQNQEFERRAVSLGESDGINVMVLGGISESDRLRSDPITE